MQMNMHPYCIYRSSLLLPRNVRPAYLPKQSTIGNQFCHIIESPHSNIFSLILFIFSAIYTPSQSNIMCGSTERNHRHSGNTDSKRNNQRITKKLLLQTIPLNSSVTSTKLLVRYISRKGSIST